MTRVWIAQCLCPKRHAVMATAAEADDEGTARARILEPLRAEVTSALDYSHINPWCGLCGAKAETWHYEVGRTRFGTMQEALPALKENERQQAATRQAFGGDWPTRATS